MTQILYIPKITFEVSRTLRQSVKVEDWIEDNNPSKWNYSPLKCEKAPKRGVFNKKKEWYLVFESALSEKSKQFWNGSQFHKSVHVMMLFKCIDWLSTCNE
jgi:hypothetical protein